MSITTSGSYFRLDLGEATLISAVGVGVYTGVRKVNCHTKGCWRIGHHALEGTPYILCRHHHPEVPNHGATHEHILAQHQTFKLNKEATHALNTKSIRVRGWVARSAAGWHLVPAIGGTQTPMQPQSS